MIHTTSFIDSSAKIADDVSIGAFCHIGKDVILESGCVIASHVIINDNVTCKSNVKVFSYANIGNNIAKIEIGENTHIREFTLIGTDEDSNKSVIVENDNFIMAYVRLSNGVKIEQNCVLTNSVTLMQNVTCKKNVIIGGLSTIEADLTIGNRVMIGGASYITKNIPPFTLVEGNKAEVRGLNLVGLRRGIKDKKEINAIKSAYKSIYKDEVDKERALELSKNSETLHVKEFCNFVAKYC